MNFWMSHQRAPACTRIVRSPGENDRMRFIERMSKCRLPGLAVWPPMLKRPPPMDTGPLVRRSASCTSSTDVCPTMAMTRTGLICVTSLTMWWSVVCVMAGSDGAVVEDDAGACAEAGGGVARAEEGAVDDQRQRAQHGHGGEQQPPCRAAAVVQA